MKYSEMICWLMWAKRYKLEECGINIPYLVKKDEKAILKWDEVISKEVVFKILSSKEDTDSSICPFCTYDSILKEVKLGYCEFCEYKLIHGECSSDISDYQSIISFLIKCGMCDKDSPSIRELLSKDRYLDWVLVTLREMYSNPKKWKYIK